MTRAAKDLQWGRMLPAGRQFDIPALRVQPNVGFPCLVLGILVFYDLGCLELWSISSTLNVLILRKKAFFLVTFGL